MSEIRDVAQILTEFGSAIRGDWGSIDGRSVRDGMDRVAASLRSGEATIASMRGDLDLCPSGEGHWTEYCNRRCTEEARDDA